MVHVLFLNLELFIKFNSGVILKLHQKIFYLTNYVLLP